MVRAGRPSLTRLRGPARTERVGEPPVLAHLAPDSAEGR